MVIDGKEIVLTGNFLKTARIDQEWYHDVKNPEVFIKELKQGKTRVDIFTFWQRLPNVEPKYDYHMELESIAAIPISTFDHWWNNQIPAKTRNMARKAEKKGVEIKVVPFNDAFVTGLVNIFNETPVRQGKPFWHYGKDFDTIKKEFSRYIHREEMIGAFYEGQMIGFIMLAFAGEYAITSQILSMIQHRDKAPTNALLAKAVEICAERNIAYLNYAMWTDSSLGAFKVNNGFLKYDLPRYFVPMTLRGKLSLKTGFHKGVKSAIPDNILNRAKQLRNYSYKMRNTLPS